MFTHFFIDRPILSSVISLVITLLGAVSYFTLPMAQYPEIVPPSILVIASYPGANAEEIVNSVAIPIETQINGVDNMIYMATSSSSSGDMNIIVTFAVGTDPDIATVLVQNRVKLAEPFLPEEVRRLGVNVFKRSTDIVMMAGVIDSSGMNKDSRDIVAAKEAAEKDDGKTVSDLFTENLTPKAKEHLKNLTKAELAERETNMPEGVKLTDKERLEAEARSSVYMANYTKLYVQDVFARVDGVGEVRVFNREDFSMRIWLDPEIMAARQISVSEVLATIREQNAQIAAGRVGQAPVPVGQKMDLSIISDGRLSNAAQFEEMVVRVDADGRMLRLRDIGRVELGALSYGSVPRYNGQSVTMMGIMQRPGANSIDVAKAMRKAMDDLRPSLKRSNLDFIVGFDATEFISKSIDEVQHAILEVVIFVSFTVFVFLQDWRATLIPLITIPVSIIGCFFLMSLFGFSINVLTLFGLVLVIGIVVDDAIIVVENTQRIIDSEGLDSKAAAKKSMIQISSPIIGTSLVLMAVFVPSGMMSGMVGQLYKQFALTIAGAVGLSTICALTLSPALCAILLRPAVSPQKRLTQFATFTGILYPLNIIYYPFSLVVNSFFVAFNWGFDLFGAFYLFIVKRLIRAGLAMLVLWFLLVAGLIFAFGFIPTGFLPDEDQAIMFCDITLPEGASSERTLEVMKELEEVIWKNTKVDGVNTVQSLVMINGFSLLKSASLPNLGCGFIRMTDWSERKAPNKNVRVIAKNLGDTLTAHFPDAIVQIVTPPPINGLGMSNGISMKLLDKRPYGSFALADTVKYLCDQAENLDDHRTFFRAITTFDPRSPQLFLHVDWPKVKRMGVSQAEVTAALQTYLGSTYVNDFNSFGRVFRVTVQAEGEFRSDREQILDIKVKGPAGMVPLRSFATFEDILSPQILSRHNMYPSAAVMGIVNPFTSSTGLAMERIKEICATLPDGYDYAWTDLTYQEATIGNQTLIMFVLSVMFGFLVLAALYESWSCPLIIMMAVPLGIMGAMLMVVLRGLSGQTDLTINMYTQIGFIVMVGLSAKNAILITEFARDLRREGASLQQAAYEAGHLRLRPIMMTSFAFILGVVPLYLASGAGAGARRALGTAVIGGMLNETMIGIFMTPVLFVIMQKFAEGLGGAMNKFLEQGRNKK
ncbi:MAG: efflux RND transporter permease subunit [Planctomycetaceae bacterium]|jgi:HAE1 family hydrophobic/amphiphilic exporter-1|nr:efflux RND transporter permease subunit [Planctomycetaceae bacterium]